MRAGKSWQRAVASSSVTRRRSARSCPRFWIGLLKGIRMIVVSMVTIQSQRAATVCTPTACSHCVQSLGTANAYSHCVQSLCAVTWCMQRLCTVSHFVLSLCAVTACSHCVQSLRTGNVAVPLGIKPLGYNLYMWSFWVGVLKAVYCGRFPQFWQLWCVLAALNKKMQSTQNVIFLLSCSRKPQ